MLFDNKATEAGKILIKNKLTIAVAESVTSGYLQAILSSGLQAAKFYQGGITAYNLGIKCRLLGVEPISANETNCVHDEVAKQISISVSKMFLSNFGLGITGYAAPFPEENIHEIFAYYAISYNKEIVEAGKLTSDKDKPELAQIDYALQLIDKLFGYLTRKFDL